MLIHYTLKCPNKPLMIQKDGAHTLHAAPSGSESHTHTLLLAQSSHFMPSWRLIRLHWWGSGRAQNDGTTAVAASCWIAETVCLICHNRHKYTMQAPDSQELKYQHPKATALRVTVWQQVEEVSQWWLYMKPSQRAKQQLWALGNFYFAEFFFFF